MINKSGLRVLHMVFEWNISYVAVSKKAKFKLPRTGSSGGQIYLGFNK